MSSKIPTPAEIRLFANRASAALLKKHYEMLVGHVADSLIKATGQEVDVLLSYYEDVGYNTRLPNPTAYDPRAVDLVAHDLREAGYTVRLSPCVLNITWPSE